MLGTICVFMLGGMKRELVPGRWQVAVEGLIGFVDDMVDASIGPAGQEVSAVGLHRLHLPAVRQPDGRDAVRRSCRGAHPFTVTSQFTFTGVMSLISFAIVLGVGFWKHGLHFFSLFVPQGTPLHRQAADRRRSSSSASWCGRSASAFGRSSPCSPATSCSTCSAISSSRGSTPAAAGSASRSCASCSSSFISALELLVAAIQAYVFALLTSLYINDAVNLH